MVPRRQHAIAVAVLIMVAAVFGLGFSAMQTVLRGGLSVGAAISLRFLFGAAGLFLLLRLNHAPLERRSLQDGIVLGILLVAIFWLQTDGLRFTTSAKSGLITSLYVPFTPLLAILLRHRVKLSHSLGAILATFGLYLLVHVPGGSLWTGWNRGDIETFFCAVICTFHVTCTAKFSRRSNAWVLAFTQVAITAVLSALITTCLSAPHGFQTAPAALHDHGVLLALAVMILFVTIFGFWGISAMQAYLSATEAAIIFSLEPVVATVVGIYWMGDHFQPLQLLGAVLIVAAMLTAELLPRLISRIRPQELSEATD